MAVSIKGKWTTAYDTGVESTHVHKLVCLTKDSGIRARGTERYDSPIQTRAEDEDDVLIVCLCVRVQCIITRIRRLGTKETG